MQDPSSPASLDAAKAELRRVAQSRRDALPPDQRAAAAETVAARALPIDLPPGAVVSGFFPFRTEISPLPLMRRLAAAGARLALPVVTKRGEPLKMRAFAFGDPLGSGQWGLREPLPEAPEVDPDLLLVPLLAFDRAGQRLGFGAGYYDRTLTRLRALKPVVALGLAFAAQEFSDVPAGPRDAPLDFVLTERDVFDFRK